PRSESCRFEAAFYIDQMKLGTDGEAILSVSDALLEGLRRGQPSWRKLWPPNPSPSETVSISNSCGNDLRTHRDSRLAKRFRTLAKEQQPRVLYHRRIEFKPERCSGCSKRSCLGHTFA